MRASHLCLVLALGLVNLNLSAQTPRALPPESRQFDFWLGEWEVTNPAGKRAGQSRIEAIAGGAGILETWSGAGGVSGRSLNAWNPARRQWQQFWVGSDGTVLELRGGLQGERMVLSVEYVLKGEPHVDRITWTPNADASVRQHWETSADGGKTWKTSFDGLYRKKE